jgi:hypothetical protein
MEVTGTVVGVVGLLAAFKSAIDAYLLIDQLFRSDYGLEDRALHFERIRKQLEKWGTEFNIDPTRPGEECILSYESGENQAMVLLILERTKQHLTEAERLLKRHTREEREKKSWRSRIRNGKDDSKNRVAWVIKDKDLLDGIIKHLNEHLLNLLQCTKKISILQREAWRDQISNLTTIDETKIHSEARNFKQEGTCEWIFDHPEYESWVSGTATNLLWICATRKPT